MSFTKVLSFLTGLLEILTSWHTLCRVSFVYVCFVIELSESTKRIHHNRSHHLKNDYLFIMWLDHTEHYGKNGSIKFTFYTHVGRLPWSLPDDTAT